MKLAIISTIVLALATNAFADGHTQDATMYHLGTGVNPHPFKPASFVVLKMNESGLSHTESKSKSYVSSCLSSTGSIAPQQKVVTTSLSIKATPVQGLQNGRDVFTVKTKQTILDGFDIVEDTQLSDQSDSSVMEPIRCVAVSPKTHVIETTQTLKVKEEPFVLPLVSTGVHWFVKMEKSNQSQNKGQMEIDMVSKDLVVRGANDSFVVIQMNESGLDHAELKSQDYTSSCSVENGVATPMQKTLETSVSIKITPLPALEMGSGMYSVKTKQVVLDGFDIVSTKMFGPALERSQCVSMSPRTHVIEETKIVKMTGDKVIMPVSQANKQWFVKMKSN
jgi:hypothetical protein